MSETTGDLLERTIMAALPGDRRPTELELNQRAEALRLAFPVDDEEFAMIMRRVQSKLVIVMDTGTALASRIRSRSSRFNRIPKSNPR